MCMARQWHSQKAETVTQIKEKLLALAWILFICFPFQNGNFSYSKKLLPKGANSFLRAVPMVYHIE